MIEIARMTLWLGLLAVAISTVIYFLKSGNQKNQHDMKIARWSYIVFSIFVTLASLFLMYFFISHDYRLEYVAKYSSSDLPLHYLISSFWAGQEGSFLLWVFIGAWLGVILMFKSSTNEARVMTIYNLQLIFLSILLIKQSPFVSVPEPLKDGFGLNMLLQDPWMVIHPPIVFIGYAAFAIPFSIAIASLWRRQYNWIKQGLPWIIFSFLSLGAGIIIGGIWSYKVLGWGGYWGWDPVENASLLPWLMGIALVHGIILQKSTGRLAKTNYFLAAFSFLLILYSTFLTRSGVLANFSVHSFVDLGITGWLLVFIALFTAISAYFLLTRAREIPLPKKHMQIESSFFSREFGLIAALVLLVLSSIITGLGTSAPLITRLAEKASKVSTQFYVNTNLPIAIFIGLLLSYIPLLKWGQNDFAKIARQMILGLIIALVAVMITMFNGFPGLPILLMVLFAGFAVGVNLELMIRLIRKSLTSASGAIIHLGVGLMLLAFIASSVYDRNERIALPQGEAKLIMGYEIKFLEPNFTREGKGSRLFLPIEVKKNQKVALGQPDIYIEAKGRSEDNRFHHPYIQRGLICDLYVSPEGFESGSDQVTAGKHLVIDKGASMTVDDYQITFTGFDLQSMGGDKTQHSMSVGANLLVSHKGSKAMPLKPVIEVGIQGNPESRVQLPGGGAFLTLVGINADKKNIEVHYESSSDENTEEGVDNSPVFYADVSIKPGMTILWLGVILVLFGGIVSTYRHWSGKSDAEEKRKWFRIAFFIVVNFLTRLSDRFQ